MREVYTIPYIKNREEKDAAMELFENDGDVEIKFQFEQKIIVKKAENYFEALLALRRELERNEMKLLCKGCCQNVYPSAMLLSMGDGRKAYTLQMGEQAKLASLVDIFEKCDSDQYASIEEQYNYYEAWINSL